MGKCRNLQIVNYYQELKNIPPKLYDPYLHTPTRSTKLMLFVLKKLNIMYDPKMTHIFSYSNGQMAGVIGRVAAMIMAAGRRRLHFQMSNWI